MKKITVVTPVYKKEQIIKKCYKRQIKSLKKAAVKHGLDYELIAVVDGSLDKSANILRSIEDPHLRVISYDRNRGKGFAVRLGMMKAKGEYVGFIDFGMDIDPGVIMHMVDAILKPDTHIVVGSKKHQESKLVYPFIRKIYTWGYSVVTRLFTGIKYDDTQVGAKMFTRELLDKVLPRILVKRFAFDIEILAVAEYLGYTNHVDVPVKIDFNTDVSIAASKTEILNMFRDTLAVGYRLRILDFYNDRNKAKWNENYYDLFVNNTL